VLEAMAQGTAVITSSGTATEEVIADAGLLVDPADVDALAAALDELLADPQRRADLGAAGFTRALERFDPRSFAMALEEIYREAISSASGAGHR
jgi:glycosyltransferase involved in cell wall biosynthesis